MFNDDVICVIVVLFLEELSCPCKIGNQKKDEGAKEKVIVKNFIWGDNLFLDFMKSRIALRKFKILGL